MIHGKTIQIIDSHTAGMPTRIITGGIPSLPGASIIEKATYFRNHFDHIRTALFQEPRGLLRGVGALITPPTTNEAHIGVFFLDSTFQTINMCGHGSIGVITAAIDFGMVEVQEPVTKVVLDTPAGLVTGHAQVQDGNVLSVSIQNVPSFLHSSTKIDVPQIGNISVDVAFGGSFFAIINSEDIGVSVDRINAARLSELGMTVKEVVNSQVDVKHPYKPIRTIDAVRICNEPIQAGKQIKNVVIFSRGDKGIDRSPCGTGTSAHLATLHAKGQLGIGEDSVHESIIGTVFMGRVISETMVEGFPAIIPEINASAYTMGLNTIILPPDDPVKVGFLLEEK